MRLLGSPDPIGAGPQDQKIEASVYAEAFFMLILRSLRFNRGPDHMFKIEALVYAEAFFMLILRSPRFNRGPVCFVF